MNQQAGSNPEQTGFISNLIKNFNLLWFIMALGFGGTSVAGFAFLNYTIKRPPGLKGLISLDALNQFAPHLDPTTRALVSFFEYHIAAFGVLHLISICLVGLLFIAWRLKYPAAYRELLNDNTRNAAIITPALALGMTFNVFLVGGVFYFKPLKDNMQALMLPALLAWLLIWLYTMVTALRVQRRYLEKGFDVAKMHFGWLLQPFALAMTAVSGTGIAALGHDPVITYTAFYLSLVPFTMAVFMTVVKLVALFQSHYEAGLPTKVEFLPSMLIVVPILTLLSISLFRYGHFFDHQLKSHLPQAYFQIVTCGGWAFMSWYLVLGLMLLKRYLADHFFRRGYFDESQWGMICPMVAFAVLGAFVYKTTLPAWPVMTLIVAFMILDVVILLFILFKQIGKICRECLQSRG